MISVMMHVVFISSPYLLVFGDDRVRCIREQRMLMQMEPVMHSREWGSTGGTSYIFLFAFGNCCKP